MESFVDKKTSLSTCSVPTVSLSNPKADPIPELRDPERAGLINQLPLALVDVDSASWACLRLSDIQVLRFLVDRATKKKATTQRLLIHPSTISALKSWAGRTRRKHPTEVDMDYETEQGSNSEKSKKRKRDDPTPRNLQSGNKSGGSDSAKELCVKRDNKTSLITRAGLPIKIAHIFPYSLGQPKHEKIPRNLWVTLDTFWSEDKTKAWKQEVLRNRKF